MSSGVSSMKARRSFERYGEEDEEGPARKLAGGAFALVSA